MLVWASSRGCSSLSCIFTLVHLIKFYYLVEAFIHFTGQGLCTLLVWVARVGMGDLTLAVLKPQLLFISSPSLFSFPLFFSVLISTLFFHLLSPLLLSSALSSAPFFLFQLPSLLVPSPPLSFFLLSSFISFTLFFSRLLQLHQPFFLLNFSSPHLLYFSLLSSKTVTALLATPPAVKIESVLCVFLRTQLQNNTKLQICILCSSTLTCYTPTHTLSNTPGCMHMHTQTHRTPGPWYSLAKLSIALNFNHG